VTVAEYRTRERFLLDVLALSQEATATMREMGVSPGGGFGFGRPQGDPSSPENRIRGVTRTLMGVYSGLSGGQVQPGSLYPPTQTMREQVEAARAELAALKSGNGG